MHSSKPNPFEDAAAPVGIGTLFIGQDLHCNNVVVTILKSEMLPDGRVIGKVIKTRKVSLTQGMQAYEDFMAPYLDAAPHIACVESTYNWYWMADLYERKGWNLVLADPATVSRDKTKACNDMTDSHFLAEALRTGTLHSAPIMERVDRSVRDLIRLRGELIQERARYLITLKNMHMMHWCHSFTRAECEALTDALKEDPAAPMPAYCDVPAVACKLRHLLQGVIYYSEQIEDLEKELEALDVPQAENRKILKTIKGCGEVLSRAIATETGDINRFKSAGNFVSYCRLAPTSKLSNNKSKGMGNAKNGNAYLSWAMTELAYFVVRYNERAKRTYDRLFKRHGLRVKAIRAVAGKLARSIWYMLQRKENFSIERCFA